MPHENSHDTIGGPEPVQPSGGSNYILALATYVALLCGGLYAFTTMIMPRRASGATSSGRLKWQQQHEQMQTELKAAQAQPHHTAD